MRTRQVDEPFNPYVEWLGLTESTVKPDHYRLLGLPPFESDARRISSACDGMLAKVRGNRPGPHLREWQSLLDELTAARNCLLDDTARAKYDVQLRDGDEPAPSTTPASSFSASSSSGSNYMWPPGFEPPAAKAAPAPSVGSVGAPVASPAASSSQPAPVISASVSMPPASTSSQSQNPPSTYAAPTAVPVLSPVMPTASPGAPSTPSSPPGTSDPPSYAGPYSYSNPPSAAPVSGSPASGAPVVNMPAWNQPPSQPGNYSAGNYSSGNYASPGYSNSSYPSPAAPIASPISNGPVAYSMPPASSYGFQGPDPMAPVTGPITSPGGVPLAQPISGYGQAAPVAYPTGGFGQSYTPPQSQPGAMGYGSPMSQAMPIAGVPSAGMPVSAAPVSGMPMAMAAGASVLQAMPAQTAMPVKAIAAAPEDDLGLKVPSTSTTKAYKQNRKRNSVSVAIAALLAASLLVVAAFFFALKDGNLFAKKADLPRDASELPIPKDVPPPHDPYATPPTTEILAPLGENDPNSKPSIKKPKRPKIGPLVEEGQEPETMPLIGPNVKKTDPPESAIPNTTPPPMKKPDEAAPVPAASPKEIAAVRKALGQALVAMGYRDWDTSKDKLAEAKALAKDEMLKEKVEAVESVSTGVKEFWRAVGESTKSLGAGQELVIGNTRVAVVEASDKLLILRVGGMNKRYQVDDLPMGLARTLASSWFDNNAASTKVFTGAFLFVEPNGDPAEVRQLWQSARQEGVNMDLLLPLLDDNLKADAKDETNKS